MRTKSRSRILVANALRNMRLDFFQLSLRRKVERSSFRGRKLSSIGYAIVLKEVFADGSGISRRMDTEGDNAIRSLDLLFKDAENECFCS